MMLADTGALYALADRKDEHHQAAVKFIRRLSPRQSLSLSIPIIAETATLLEWRLGARAGRAFWADITRGVFTLLPVDDVLFTEALKIDRQYADLEMGLVDCTSLALCERHRIDHVFTFDRKHFGAYKPDFADSLKLLP